MFKAQPALEAKQAPRVTRVLQVSRDRPELVERTGSSVLPDHQVNQAQGDSQEHGVNQVLTVVQGN